MDSGTQEKVSNLVTNFGQELLQYLKDGTEFAKGQAPLVCQEIINWGMMSSIMFASIGILIVLIGLFFTWLTLKSGKDTNLDDVIGVLILFGIFPIIIGLIIALVNLYTLLYIWSAPRLYLIDQIKEIVR